jgi:formylmethanofuran dehydrogenase subunit E
MSEKDLGPIPELCPCDSCGHLIPTEPGLRRHGDAEVLCPPCFQEKLRPCEECGSLIRAAAYQHLSSGRVLCEPWVVKKITAT